MQWRLRIFSGWLLRNLNYTNFNKRIASYIDPKKKKKKTQIQKVVRFPSTMFF